MKLFANNIRGSALVLITLIQLFNIYAILFFISLLRRKTLGNAWIGMLIYIGLLIFNFNWVDKNKSDTLLVIYKDLPAKKNKQMKRWLGIYITISSLALLLIYIVRIYVKSKYGN